MPKGSLRWGDVKDRATELCWVTSRIVIWRKLAHEAACPQRNGQSRPRTQPKISS